MSNQPFNDEDHRCAFQLIKSMLDHNPKNRPTVTQVLSDNYFKRIHVGPDKLHYKGKKISFEIDKLIARGNDGIFVYEGLYEGIHSVAVKRFQRSSIIDESAVKREAELMLLANDHPNILRYFSYDVDENFLYLATELCIGTLQHLVEKTLPKIEICINEREVLFQVSQGLAHLHSLKIIHRDVKPTNLLIYQPVGSDSKPVMKVADFGISKFLKAEQADTTNSNRTNPKGTRGWMAPEQYDSDRFDYKVDIFTLGCVFGYTLSIGGIHPFGDDIDDRIYRVKKKMSMTLTQEDLKEPYSLEGDAFRLIQSMVAMDHEKRPSALEVLKNVFFNCMHNTP